MNIYVILIGIAYLVVLYEIWSGETISNRRSHARSVSRKAEPVKFWLNIAVHLIILTVLMIYNLGLIG